jgi:hypothetical protein
MATASEVLGIDAPTDKEADVPVTASSVLGLDKPPTPPQLPSDASFLQKIDASAAEAIRKIGAGIDYLAKKTGVETSEQELTAAKNLLGRDLTDSETKIVQKNGAASLADPIPQFKNKGWEDYTAHAIGGMIPAAVITAPFAGAGLIGKSITSAIPFAIQQGEGEREASQAAGESEEKQGKRFVTGAVVGGAVGSVPPLAKIPGLTWPLQVLARSASSAIIGGAGSAIEDVAQGRDINVPAAVEGAATMGIMGAFHSAIDERTEAVVRQKLQNELGTRWAAWHAENKSGRKFKSPQEAFADLKSTVESELNKRSDAQVSAAQDVSTVAQSGAGTTASQVLGLTGTESTNVAQQQESTQNENGQRTSGENSPSLENTALQQNAPEGAIASESASPSPTPAGSAREGDASQPARLPLSAEEPQVTEEPQKEYGVPAGVIEQRHPGPAPTSPEYSPMTVERAEKMSPEDWVAHFEKNRNLANAGPQEEAFRAADTIVHDPEQVAKLGMLADQAHLEMGAALEAKAPYSTLAGLQSKEQFFEEALGRALAKNVPPENRAPHVTSKAEVTPSILAPVKQATISDIQQSANPAPSVILPAEGEGLPVTTSEPVNLHTYEPKPEVPIKQRIAAINQGIQGMVKTSAALRDYYRGQQAAAETAARAQSRLMVSNGWTPPAPAPTAGETIAASVGGIGRSDVAKQQAIYYAGQKAAAAAADTARKNELSGMDRQVRQDGKDLQKHLISAVRSLPAQTQGVFITDIAEATRPPPLGQDPAPMYEKSAKVLSQISEIADLIDRQNTENAIAKMVENAKGSSSIAVQQRRDIAMIAQSINLGKLDPAKIAELNDIKAVIERHLKIGATPSLTPQQIREVSLLDKTNLSDLPINALNALHDRIKLLTEIGKTRWDNSVARSEARMQQMRSAFKADAGKSFPITHGQIDQYVGRKLSIDQKIAVGLHNLIIKTNNAASDLNRAIAYPDIIANINDGSPGGPRMYKGAVCKVIKGTVDLGYIEKMQLREQFLKPIQECIRRNGGYTKEESDRINIYGIAQQEGGREDLIDRGGLSANTVDQVLATMTPKELDFYRTARALYDGPMRTMLVNHMESVHNAEVQLVNNYWPYRLDYQRAKQYAKQLAKNPESGLETEVPNPLGSLNDSWGHNVMMPRLGTKVDKGHTITRLENAQAPIIAGNGVQAVLNSIDTVSHQLAYDRPMLELGKVIREPAFAAQYGDLGQQYWLRHLNVIARDENPSGSVRWRPIDLLQNNTSICAVGLRGIAQLKHLGNFPLAISICQPNHMAQGLMDSLTSDGTAWIKKWAPEIEHRKSGGEVTIQDLMTGNTWQRVQANSFILERVLDYQLARGLIVGLYHQELEASRLLTDDYLQGTPNLECLRVALSKSREAVTSALLKDQPALIAQGLGKNITLARLVTQYTNNQMRVWSVARHKFADQGIREIGPVAFAITSLAMLGYLALEAYISLEQSKLIRAGAEWLAGGHAKKKPEEPGEFYREMALGVLKTVPWGSNAYNMAKWNETSIPLVDTIVKGTHNTYQLATNTGEFGHKLSQRTAPQKIADVAGFGASVFGIPGGSTFVQGYKDYLRAGGRVSSIFDTPPPTPANATGKP